MDNISPVGMGESRISGLQSARVRAKPTPHFSVWNYCGVCQEKMRTNNKGDTRDYFLGKWISKLPSGHPFFNLVNNLGSHSSLKCVTVDGYINLLKYSFFPDVKWRLLWGLNEKYSFSPVVFIYFSCFTENLKEKGKRTVLYL